MGKIKIGIQGIRGAFHEIAARKYFGSEITIEECLTFKDLCEKLMKDEVDYCMMAIENTIAGSILTNYNLLQKYHFKIIGEEYLHIRMNLVGLPGTKLSDIKQVHSHPMAIAQCDEFLHSIMPVKIVNNDDTALAARMISENKLKDTAAIANEFAAKLYNLSIISERIETNKQNFTRFLVLSKKNVTQTTCDKASLFFRIRSEIGSLSKILGIFQKASINMTKIQSVPVIGEPYQYSFHVDLEWDNYDNYKMAMYELSKQTHHLSVLGEYKKNKYELGEEYPIN